MEIQLEISSFIVKITNNLAVWSPLLSPILRMSWLSRILTEPTKDKTCITYEPYFTILFQDSEFFLPLKSFVSL